MKYLWKLVESHPTNLSGVFGTDPKERQVSALFRSLTRSDHQALLLKLNKITQKMPWAQT